MDRLRRTLSFRSRKKKRKQQQTESSKPHQWQEDERKVREGTCSFQVKYLGCVEVFESRGMQVCEEAHKVLRHNAKKQTRLSFRKKPKNRQKVVQAILYISGDSLRVIEDKAGINQDDGQGLIVDQTIEKVSFCAPDRSHEKGFSYICRDGTTRRWMCHGFLALKESGERLSHAVGCAFAVCLEKKQQREKEAVSVSYSENKTSFARLGSFRQATLTERLADPQSTKIAEPVGAVSSGADSGASSPSVSRPQAAVSSTENPIGIQRPHASANLLLRQGSFREFTKLNSQTSPFKRNLSLRLNELPSNLTRQQNDFNRPQINNQVPIIEGEEEQLSPQSSSTAQSITDSGTGKGAPAPAGNGWDPIAEMCQQLTKGLTGLNAADAATANSQQSAANPIQQTNPWAGPAVQDNDFWLPSSSTTTSSHQVSSVTSTATQQQQSAASTQLTRSGGVGLHHANTYAGPFTSAVLVAPPTSNGLTTGVSQQAQNPFDTAWALRSTSTNPFLTASSTVSVSHNVNSTAGSTTVSSSSSAQQQTQFSKEFEIKM